MTRRAVRSSVDEVEHSSKSFLAHLIGVYKYMEARGCNQELCRAGMFHSIYGTEDPSAIYYRAVPQRIRKVGNAYVLHLQLPFVSKDDVDITHREGELYVTVGPYKREISLPRVLSGKKVTRGKLEEGMLSVTFSDSR